MVLNLNHHYLGHIFESYADREGPDQSAQIIWILCYWTEKGLIGLDTGTRLKTCAFAKTQRHRLTFYFTPFYNLTLNSFSASGDFCRLLITFANSLDPSRKHAYIILTPLNPTFI